jgi:hypothetical protein
MMLSTRVLSSSGSGTVNSAMNGPAGSTSGSRGVMMPKASAHRPVPSPPLSLGVVQQ